MSKTAMSRDARERVCKALLVYAETIASDKTPELLEYNKVELEELHSTFLELGGDFADFQIARMRGNEKKPDVVSKLRETISGILDWYDSYGLLAKDKRDQAAVDGMMNDAAAVVEEYDKSKKGKK